jgi:hypothetical protein
MNATLTFCLLEEWNQSAAMYDLTVGYWNKLILLNILDILQEVKKDLNAKILNFSKILGTIYQIFKPSSLCRHTRIQIYDTLKFYDKKIMVNKN